ncbi:MAG: VOC family protein [Steroidobacteraceae bacterium]
MAQTDSGGARFHHIGFVVSSVEAAAQGFIASLGATWDGEVFVDPLQRVRVSFLCIDVNRTRLELVEPLGPGSPVSRFLATQGGLHHICLETLDTETSLQRVRNAGGAIVSRPKPAVAFGGRTIAWALTREKLLVEFLAVDGA